MQLAHYYSRLLTLLTEFHNTRNVVEFTPYMWHTLVDYAEVSTDGTITFTFKDGSRVLPLSENLLT